LGFRFTTDLACQTPQPTAISADTVTVMVMVRVMSKFIGEFSLRMRKEITGHASPRSIPENQMMASTACATKSIYRKICTLGTADTASAFRSPDYPQFCAEAPLVATLDGLPASSRPTVFGLTSWPWRPV
jgi:hypothetical protein